MIEENYKLCFQIISEAGDAKSKAMEAVKCSEIGNYAKAEELLDLSRNFLKKAHQIQTDMMHNEINGENIPFSVLLVHSQDHFAMATMAIEMSETVLNLYKQLNEKGA